MSRTGGNVFHSHTQSYCTAITEFMNLIYFNQKLSKFIPDIFLTWRNLMWLHLNWKIINQLVTHSVVATVISIFFSMHLFHCVLHKQNTHGYWFQRPASRSNHQAAFHFCNWCDDLPLSLSLQDHPWVELAEALSQLFVICCWWAPDYTRSRSGKCLFLSLYTAGTHTARTHASLTNMHHSTELPTHTF